MKTYTARFGIVPVTQKLEKLKNLKDVEISKVKVGSFKGFLVRGAGQRGPVVRAQLIETEKELDVGFYFYGAGAEDDGLIDAILSSLKAL